MRIGSCVWLRHEETHDSPVDAPNFAGESLPLKNKTERFVRIDIDPQGLFRSSDFPGVAVVILEWISVTRQSKRNGMQQQNRHNNCARADSPMCAVQVVCQSISTIAKTPVNAEPAGRCLHGALAARDSGRLQFLVP